MAFKPFLHEAFPPPRSMQKEKKRPILLLKILYIYLGDWVYYSERRREGASVRRGLVAALVRVPCPPDMI